MKKSFNNFKRKSAETANVIVNTVKSKVDNIPTPIKIAAFATFANSVNLASAVFGEHQTKRRYGERSVMAKIAHVNTGVNMVVFVALQGVICKNMIKQMAKPITVTEVTLVDSE